MSEKFLIECKTKVKESSSHTIKKEWITKNKEECFSMGKPYSAICFDFGDGVNSYIIDEALFKILKDYLENN